MQIGGLRKLSLADYPNTLSCVVYLIGCNLRCPWCNASDLVLPNAHQNQPIVSKKKFFDFLRKRKNELDGVVISGGEPTIHPSLPWFCKEIKNLGYRIKLDTNGLNPVMVKSLIDDQLIDYIAMDIKSSPEKYSQMIGLEDCSINYLLNKIEKSIDLIKNGKIDYEFRTTLVPGFLEKKDILTIARQLKGAKKYYLQSFKKENLLSPEYMILDEYPLAELVKIQQAIAPFFETCEIRY